MIKFIVGGVAILLIVLYVVFGPRVMSSHVEATVQEVRQTALEMEPDTHLAARIRIELTHLAESFQKHQETLLDMKDRLQENQKELDGVNARLDVQSEILRKVGNFLNSSEDVFHEGDKTYSRETVQEDTAWRLQRVELLKKDKESLEKSLAMLHEGVKSGDEAIGKMDHAIREKKAELEMLEVRLANGNMLNEVGRIVSETSGISFEADPELNVAMDEFERRVKSVERKISSQSMVNQETSKIEFAEEKKGESRDLNAQIASFLESLDGSSPAAPAESSAANGDNVQSASE